MHPVMPILWGRNARGARSLPGPLPAVESAHPSRVSVDRGFFGSKPFGRAGELLVWQDTAPVDRRLP